MIIANKFVFRGSGLDLFFNGYESSYSVVLVKVVYHSALGEYFSYIFQSNKVQKAPYMIINQSSRGVSSGEFNICTKSNSSIQLFENQEKGFLLEK